MYKQRYYKYKNKYLQLKSKSKSTLTHRIGQGEGSFIEPDFTNTGFTTNIAFPEVIEQDQFMQDDILITRAENEVYPYDPFIEDTKAEALETDIVYDNPPDVVEGQEVLDEKGIKDVGMFGLARGRDQKFYEFDPRDFITIGDEVNKRKILLIDNVDDFDDFTYDYGSVVRLITDDRKEEQDVLYIRWNDVQKDYRGVYIDEGLQTARLDDAFFDDKYYESWLANFGFEVLIFSRENYNLFFGQVVRVPFGGKIFNRNDFTSNMFMRLPEGVDKNKILVLDTFSTFDEFTNKYGQRSKNSISIKWDDVKRDYKGFIIDKDSELYPDRYVAAFYKDVPLISWWRRGKLQKGMVYIFS